MVKLCGQAGRLSAVRYGFLLADANQFARSRRQPHAETVYGLVEVGVACSPEVVDATRCCCVLWTPAPVFVRMAVVERWGIDGSHETHLEGPCHGQGIHFFQKEARGIGFLDHSDRVTL